MTVIADRPSLVIGPRSERPLDGADAPSLNAKLPGFPTLQQASSGYVHVGPGEAVWVRHAGRWRQGWAVGQVGRTAHPSASTGGKLKTVPVEYVADRTGRVLVHRFPVGELRLRDVGAEAQDVAS